MEMFCVSEFVKDAIPYVVDTAVYTAIEVGQKFVANYDKRRDVGFTPWPSITGSFDETKRYYCDSIMGRTHIPDKAAIYFIGGTKRRHF